MSDQPALGQKHRIDTDTDRCGTRRRPVPNSPRRTVFVAITVLMIAIAACATDDVPPSLLAELVVATGPVSVGGEEVGTGEGGRIQLGSQITLGEGARGFLTVRDLGRFELFKQARIRLESWEPTQATAFLDVGHVTFTIDEASGSRLILETSSSSIKTLEPATTQFTVCQPESGDTCLVVQTGSVELTSAGVSETYEEGEGTFTEAAFLTNGEPPEPAICLPRADFEAWFEKARVNEESPALGSLVGMYPACGAPPPTTSVVRVPGTVLWTDSGIDVAMGDEIEIKAGGTILHSEDGPLLTPEGDPNLRGHESNLAGLEDENHAALIGRIGEDGTPFVVGLGIDLVSESEGRLYLGVNDVGVGNNGGEFVALVTLVTP